jgi:DNA polymerase-3 subunit beta
MHNITFDIDIRALKAAAIAAGTEQTRYYLNGVCVQHTPTGPVFVATDGHRLIAARHDWLHNAPEAFEPVIVPLDLIKRIKLSRKSSDVATVTLSVGDDGARKVAVDYAGGSVAAAAVDGTFPDWRRVIPQSEPSGVACQFQAQYFDAFRDAMAILAGGKGDAQPNIAHNGDNPAIVDLGDAGAVEAFGVLMPLRIKRDFLTRAPAWASVTGASVATAE